MGASIPASAIVNVYPNVINAGGTGLDLGGLILTNSTRVPIGSVARFTSADAVAAFFGASSTEAALAANYFLGFDGSSIKPAQLLFVQVPNVAAAAPYLRGAAVSALTLAQLQGYNGTITLSINGQAVTSSAIDLSGATSFSNAASLIEAAINHYDATFTASIAGTTMTVTAVAGGTLAVGQAVVGPGVSAGTVISGLGSGTGGTGTYTVSNGQTVSSATLNSGKTRVTYDSQSGAFVVTGGTPGAAGTITFATTGTLADQLKLTSAAGAVVSQGASVGTPGAVMAAVAASTQDFATFLTAFKPSTDDMVAYATWANGTNNRFLYLMWDNDGAATTLNASTTAARRCALAELSGTLPIYDPANGMSVAAFVAGAIASIDFNAAEGRTTLAFRSQIGLPAGVTDRTIADNLIANGYNFYGAYATANDQFTFLYPGSVLGPYLWADSFINQVWMNNAFQLALMTLLTNIKSIPYNAVGYALVEAALLDAIQAAVTFGAIRAGVTLSSGQRAEVNAAAGVVIADTLQQRGWYLQVQPASPQVRAARGSPPINLWYTDGQSIQKIALNSVEVQ